MFLYLLLVIQVLQVQLKWVDPETELIYIFLSNRIHPDLENLKLLKMDVRTEIMKEIYKHFGNKK